MASTTIDVLSARFGPNYRWWVTLTGMIGNIALIISSTIVNVAIPQIMGTYGVGQDKAQWLSAGFLASMTASMLLNAWMVAAIGRRNTYLLAMSVFVTGSVLGGLSPNFDTLVMARVMQGAGAGLIQPLALQVIFEIFPPAQRGRAMGFFGFGIVLAPAVGPTIGGILVDTFNWRAVFFLVLPFCALGTTMALFFMPGRDESVKRPAFDWTGFTLMVVALATLLIGLSNGLREGWGSDIILTYFGIAAVGVVCFIGWEAYTDHPLLNLRLFRNGRFGCCCVVSMCWGVGIFGLWYVVPLFTQIVQGYTPTRAGLLLMPAGLLLALSFPLTGRISDRFEPRLPIIGGLLLTGSAILFMTNADRNTPFWLFAWWLIFGRVGLGFVFPALTAGALRALPPEQVSQGAGLMSFFRQLGAAFGVNMLATLIETRKELYTESFIATQTSGNEATQDWMREMLLALERAGTPQLLQMRGAIHYLRATIETQATMLGFRDAFLTLGLVFLFAILPSALLGKRRDGSRL